MPNIKVDMYSFKLTYGVGVCGMGILNRKKIAVSCSPIIDTLCKDTELQADDLGVAIEDKTVWRAYLTRRSTPI